MKDLIDVFPIEMVVKNYEHHARHQVFLEILKSRSMFPTFWPAKKQRTRRKTSEASDPDLEEAELTDQEASDWSGSPVIPRGIGLKERICLVKL